MVDADNDRDFFPRIAAAFAQATPTVRPLIGQLRHVPGIGNASIQRLMRNGFRENRIVPLHWINYLLRNVPERRLRLNEGRTDIFHPQNDCISSEVANRYGTQVEEPEDAREAELDFSQASLHDEKLTLPYIESWLQKPVNPALKSKPRSDVDPKAFGRRLNHARRSRLAYHHWQRYNDA